MNDEFCRILYLNYPSVVVHGSPPASGKLYHLCVQQLKVYSSRKACLLASRSLMSSFTCVWSSVAGREAHMHFTSTLVIFGLVRIRVYWPIHNLTSHWSGWDLVFLPIIPCIYSSILKQLSFYYIRQDMTLVPQENYVSYLTTESSQPEKKLQRAYIWHTIVTFLKMCLLCTY